MLAADAAGFPDRVEKGLIRMDRQETWAFSRGCEFGSGEFAVRKVELRNVDHFALRARVRAEIDQRRAVWGSRGRQRGGSQYLPGLDNGAKRETNKLP